MAHEPRQADEAAPPPPVGGVRHVPADGVDPSRGRCPDPPSDPTWLVEVRGDDPALRRVHESLLTVADGRVGTRGTPEERSPGHEPLVMAAGVFDRPADDGIPRPLGGPSWFAFELAAGSTEVDADHVGDSSRVLDLREGVLHRTIDGDGGAVMRSVRFASLDRPGVLVARVEHREPIGDGDPLAIDDGASTRPHSTSVPERGGGGDGPAWTVHRGAGGITATVATDHRRVDGVHVADRVAVVHGDPYRAPDPESVLAALASARSRGIDGLLDDHRQAWRARWATAAVSIDGDPAMERAVRFGLFHLIGSVADHGEAAVGARGMTGEGYAGHVFWDADVFVLPFLAATHSAASRAMLEYRIRRLDPARERAAEEGREGARFPWESACDGREATPRSAVMPNGEVWPILTGVQEEHIVADVAWAAWCHRLWSGDADFLRGEGRPLVVETARYWASRIEPGDDGRGHIRHVIGPDEYHETVDDNVFTNVMARWCLRRGADLLDEDGDRGRDRASQWRSIAEEIVDGRRGEGRGHEQFTGYDRLEPLFVSDIGSPPLAADLLLGRERLAASQVIKQPDVLMLHHLVPEEMPAGSLAVDLDHYLPRTAHGSSLSPAIHASLLARLGRPEEALALLRLSAELDLGDRTGTTAGGLHVATMGGVWQALAFGMLGLSPGPAALGIDPAPLPAEWRELELRVVFHGAPLVVRLGHDRLAVTGPRRARVALVGDPRGPVAPPQRWHRDDDGRWTESDDD